MAAEVRFKNDLLDELLAGHDAKMVFENRERTPRRSGYYDADSWHLRGLLRCRPECNQEQSAEGEALQEVANKCAAIAHFPMSLSTSLC
jgi:hypothetical protein